MRFLLDANVAQSVKSTLRASGFEAFHVADVRLGVAPDEAILSFATRHRYIVVTHDKDFGNIVRMPPAEHRGVIMLRFRDQRPHHVGRHLLSFLEKGVEIGSSLVVLSEHGYRVYHSP